MRVYVSRVPGVPGIPGSAYPAGSIKPVYPDAPEPEAYEEWQLGGDSASLVGRKRGLILTPGSAPPSFSASSATIPEGAGIGLRSNIADSAEHTMCAVVRWDTLPTGSGGIIFGTSQIGSGDGLGNALMRTNAGPVNALVRPNTATQAFGSAVVAPLAGKWVYVALSISRGDSSRRAFIGGVGSAPATTAVAYTPSARGLALGNAYYADNNYRAGLTVASFFVVPRALNDATLASMFAREVAKQAGRGIDVYTGS